MASSLPGFSFFHCCEPREAGLTIEQLDAASEDSTLALVNTLVGGMAILGAYLVPMYLVGHWHARALAWLAVTAGCSAVLYFTWYKMLPASSTDADRGTIVTR